MRKRVKKARQKENKKKAKRGRKVKMENAERVNLPPRSALCK